MTRLLRTLMANRYQSVNAPFTENQPARFFGKAGNKLALSGRLLMKKRRLLNPGYETKATQTPVFALLERLAVRLVVSAIA